MVWPYLPLLIGSHNFLNNSLLCIPHPWRLWVPVGFACLQRVPSMERVLFWILTQNSYTAINTLSPVFTPFPTPLWFVWAVPPLKPRQNQVSHQNTSLFYLHSTRLSCRSTPVASKLLQRQDWVGSSDFSTLPYISVHTSDQSVFPP